MAKPDRAIFDGIIEKHEQFKMACAELDGMVDQNLQIINII